MLFRSSTKQFTWQTNYVSSDDQIACEEETVLYGQAGRLDSLNLVSLILDVEEAVNERTGSAARAGRRAGRGHAAQPIPRRPIAGRLRP